MAPERIRFIRQDAGLSLTDMAALLRISDRSTIHRWEKGQRPISGPASIILELIEADALPGRYYIEAGVKVPLTEGSVGAFGHAAIVAFGDLPLRASHTIAYSDRYDGA